MEMKFKYVIIDRIKPVIFSPAIQHVDAAKGIIDGKEHRKVTSAGFVTMVFDQCDAHIQCGGFSDSLNIGPSDNDAAMIEKMGGCLL